MEGLKLLFVGKVYNGYRWVYGELWKYCNKNVFKVVELESEES